VGRKTYTTLVILLARPRTFMVSVRPNFLAIAVSIWCQARAPNPVPVVALTGTACAGTPWLVRSSMAAPQVW
jgi:hypothetical protein